LERRSNRAGTGVLQPDDDLSDGLAALLELVCFADFVENIFLRNPRSICPEAAQAEISSAACRIAASGMV
jgi:hypothetical protein